MKKLTLIALSLIAASAAMADGLSREQVIAELQQARAQGTLELMHSENPGAFGRAIIGTPSTVSRAEVLAQLKQARDSGALERRSRESYEPVITTNGASGKTRAQVLAELQQARANGELDIDSNQGGYAHLASLKGGNKAATQQLLAGQPASAQ